MRVTVIKRIESIHDTAFNEENESSFKIGL
jgi:hypothetical protein